MRVPRYSVGIVIFATVVDQDGAIVDISAAVATGSKIFLLNPVSGATVEREASFVTDGTDGKMKMTSESGDFDGCPALRWKVKVTLGSSVYYSIPRTIEIVEDF